MEFSIFRKHSLLALFVLCTAPTALQGQYLRVTGSSVNVRQGPSVGTVVIGIAEAGDIFEELGKTEEWYEIRMFSGENRYIHASLVEATERLPTLPTSEETRRMAFEGFLRAEDRSFLEAEARNPSPDHPASTDLQQILDDRYKLQISHYYSDIHPCHFERIKLEGMEKGWDRIGNPL